MNRIHRLSRAINWPLVALFFIALLIGAAIGMTYADVGCSGVRVLLNKSSAAEWFGFGATAVIGIATIAIAFMAHEISARRDRMVARSTYALMSGKIARLNRPYELLLMFLRRDTDTRTASYLTLVTEGIEEQIASADWEGDGFWCMDDEAIRCIESVDEVRSKYRWAAGQVRIRLSKPDQDLSQATIDKHARFLFRQAISLKRANRRARTALASLRRDNEV